MRTRTVGRQVSYDVYEAQTFWDNVMSLQRDDGSRAALMESLIELRRQPFHNPVLQTHDVGVGLNGRKVFSSDVGDRRSDRRLVWQVFDRTLVLLLCGNHSVRDRVRRMRVLRDLEDDGAAASDVAALLVSERPVMSWINLGEVFSVVRRAAPRILQAGRITSELPLAFAVATAPAHDAELWTGHPELLVAHVPWAWRDLR